MCEPFLPHTLTFRIEASSQNSAGIDLGSGTTGNALRLLNASTAIAHVTWSSSAPPTAGLDHTVIAPGAVDVIQVPPTVRYVAALLRDGSGDIFVCKGEGL